MTRTTEEAVKSIMLREYDSVRSPCLLPFIEVASVMVDNVISCATSNGATVSDKQAELLERYLAAHAYQLADPGYQSRRTGDASGTFNGKTGVGLESSRFGMMAKTLDTTGCLASMDAGNITASISWGGFSENEQTDYDQRN